MNSASRGRLPRERQDIVYREIPAPGVLQPPGKQAPHRADRCAVLHPDQVTLFRLSAPIFYAHRIHYDVDYARDVQGFPELVVHGPLTAALLAGFRCAGCLGLKAFDLRAHAPLFAGQSLHLAARELGDRVDTWAPRDDGTLAMTVALDFQTSEPALMVRYPMFDTLLALTRKAPRGCRNPTSAR